MNVLHVIANPRPAETSSSKKLAFEFFARTHHATDARADHANGVRSVCQYRRNAEREQGRV